MKRRRVWVAGLVVLLLGAATVIVVRGWPPSLPWFNDSCGIPQSIAPDASTVPPDTGGIRVTDQGFSQPIDEFKSVSLAAILENTTGSIAYHTRVTFQLLDAQDKEVTGFEGTGDQIPILMPGQRVGVGITVSPTRTEAANRQVAAFRVETSPSRWLDRDSFGDDFEPVTAEYRRTIRRDPTVPHSTEIHFIPTSDTCRPLVGEDPAVVFRDNRGKIVGGMRRYSMVTEACAHNGRETWVIPLKATPPTADDTRTEIYPYCDLQR